MKQIYDYQEYKSRVFEILREKYGEDVVRDVEVTKNNNTKLEGIGLRVGTNVASPIIYLDNRRGSVTEHQVEELAGIQAIETVCKEWRHFGCVTNDLKFEEDGVLYVDFIHQDINRECPEEHWWYPSMGQLEAFFERENEEYISVEDF